MTVYAEKMTYRYETVLVDCPHCQAALIYNRVDDLGTLEPIGHQVVRCLRPECALPFGLTCDRLSAPHEFLLHEAHEAMGIKEYRRAVLATAQAYECFLALFLHVALIFDPFANDSTGDLAPVNDLLQKLANATQKMTFKPLRNAAVRVMTTTDPPRSLAAAARLIEGIGSTGGDLSMADLDLVQHHRQAELIQRLLACNVDIVRNHVIHKLAYRPSRQEASDLAVEAKQVLLVLASHLGIEGDDINWYVNRARRA